MPASGAIRTDFVTGRSLHPIEFGARAPCPRLHDVCVQASRVTAVKLRHVSTFVGLERSDSRTYAKPPSVDSSLWLARNRESAFTSG
jgi:hypothetical protein